MKYFNTHIQWLCLLLACLFYYGSKAQTRQAIDQLQAETETDLVDNLLPFWINHAVDPDGGFYGTLFVDGSPARPAAGRMGRLTEKGSILNARILWTFASAYRIYGYESYRQMADRAARYYIDHFIDRKYGGVFWTVDAEGAPSDVTKQSYPAAFGIYALSEYFRATGNQESLDAALAIYQTLEQHAHDKSRMGYIEVFNRDYTKAGDEGVDGDHGASKTMNTHIHIMEAYSNLYRVWPDAGLKANILELLDILSSKLYSPETKHLILFCKDDWTPLERVDSYGHDIETSWLLCEAAELVGDEALIRRTQQQAVEMTDVALAEGMEPSGVLQYERDADGKVNNKRSWWPQCETVIGCINAWQITGQKRYFDAAVHTWQYIKQHFIDPKDGGWHMLLTEDGQPTKEPKASLWNCPYHNSRMGFELKSRLKHPAVHSLLNKTNNPQYRGDAEDYSVYSDNDYVQIIRRRSDECDHRALPVRQESRSRSRQSASCPDAKAYEPSPRPVLANRRCAC